MSRWAPAQLRAKLTSTALAAGAVVLTTACLIPLFHSLKWLVPSMLGIAVVATLGASCRALAVPIPLVPVIEFIGLVITITVVFASEAAWAKLVPTSESMDVLRGLTAQGRLDIQALAAPVPSLPGIVLVTLFGIGILALSIDTLAVSARSPLLAGLPILAAYLTAALILLDQAPWWLVAPPAAGWLVILAADQRNRLRDWARLPGSTPIHGLSSMARRTSAVAIAAALLLAAFAPVSVLAPWRTGTGGIRMPELGAVILDPLVSMRRNLVQAKDTEVLWYRTNDPSPSYLRLVVLEAFDGVTWSPRAGVESGRDVGLPLPGRVHELPTGRTSTYDISVTSLDNRYLPLPDPIVSVVDLSGMAANWRFDPRTGVGSSSDQPATGLHYEVTALDPGIRPSDLRDATAPSGGFWPLLDLPGGMSPQIGLLAEQVTASAQTRYDKALALQRWFTSSGGFRYSTAVRSGAGADYIAEFLKDRVGYCEQFAGAMAVMSRSLGIPARVAVGFTQGGRDTTGRWQVTARDAHAWPELWFDGLGWVRFEPTPRSDGTVVTPDYAATGTAARPGPGSRGVADAEGFTPVSTVGTGNTGWPIGAAGAVLVLLGLAVLALPMLRRVRRRRRRLHTRSYPAVVNGAWEEIADTSIDLGQPWPQPATPRQAGARLSRGMSPGAAAALLRLRAEVEQVRYGSPPEMHPERAAAVREDVRTVRAELRGRVRWQVRLASYCWPSSERRRQRSSMRSMKPGDLGGAAGLGFSGESVVAAGRAWKAE